MPLAMQPSFAKGEISSALYGRVDTQAYQVALRKARNCIIHPYGGVSNRAGTYFIGPVGDHSYTPRLIEFIFKTTDRYVLEFGHEYMRVIRDDGHVVESPKTITGITAANPGVVTAVAHGYSEGDEIYISGVVGMTELNGRRFIVGAPTTDTFELWDQVDQSDFDTSGYTAYISGGEAERIYTIATPFQQEDLFEIKYTQSADIMTLTHPNYPVQELSRTGHDAWTLTQPTFEPAVDHPVGQTVTVNSSGSVTHSYRVTAVDTETGEESLPALNSTTRNITGVTQANPAVVTSAAHGFSNGDEVEINGIVGMTELNGRRFIVANVATDTFELRGENSTSYTAYDSGGTANQTFVRITNSNATTDNTIAVTEVPGNVKYNFYKANNGIYGFIGESDGPSFTDKNMAADLDITPPSQRNPFRTPGSYPGAVGYYEQRRMFGGSNDNPDTTDYSRTGADENFTRSSPSQQDDAIRATLTSRQVNAIRHYVPGNDLLIFTEGSEWKVNSGQDVAFAADTLRQKPQSNWGSSHHRPLTIGNTTLFVQENRTTVRSIGYKLDLDGYTGTDLTLLASHLFAEHRISDWAFARSPDPIVYAVREDGKLGAMTFHEEQQVIAWAPWDTKGKFEAVCTSRPTSDSVDDAAYFVVKRRIGGRTVRYIERTNNRRFTDVRDCYFVDCGLSLDNPVTITNVTATNPVVVTAPSHGFSNGDEVDIADIEWEPNFDSRDNETQPDQLNGRRYTVANATTDTFELSGVDGSAFNAYVDGGTARRTTTVVSGLWHLEGEPVAVLANGDVVSNLTVENGRITLPRKASRVHIGLKYISDIETLDIEDLAGVRTIIQGRMKKNAVTTFRFEKSRGALIGPNFQQLEEVFNRESENWDAPTELLTGDKRVVMPPSWNTKGRICLRQRYPLPLTLLAVIPDFDAGE